MISARVPNSDDPTGRTDTLASMRSEPFFHLHVGHTDREQRRAQLLDVALRLLGRTDVGLAHDLEQRHARAVVVDEGVVGVVNAPAATDVQRLPGVFLEVRA